MPKQGKKFRAAAEKLNEGQQYTVDEAVSYLNENKCATFDETIDIAINLNVDPRHADQMVRGMVVLPSGTGKTVKVAVFAKGDKAEEAKKAGADIIGEDDLVDRIKGGDIDFDRVVATPDLMPKVGQVARILGPKGLMPNPKLGTVTNDIAKAVKEAKGGQVEFKAEKNGVVHAGIGKTSFDAKAVKDNVVAFIKALQNARPTGVKGTYIKRISVSSTMGPGVALDIADVLEQVA